MADEFPSSENPLPPFSFREHGNARTLSQEALFNVRVSTELPGFPIGQHLSFVCLGEDGRTYYCKDDFGHIRIRATEWLATKLADHLGISVAECAVLERQNGEKLFGSRAPFSVAAEFELNHYLNRAVKDELGRPGGWLGQYFARVWAYDIFLDNPDRDLRNFVLDKDGHVARLRAIDFGSARLLGFPDTKFPIASEPTSAVGKIVRNRHGVHCDAAYELLERIGAVPASVVQGILSEMPEEWLSNDQMGGFVEVWSNGFHRARANQVKALIEHDWKL